MGAALKVAELPAGRGFAWIAQAFHLFRKKPFAWIGLCAGWLLVTLFLHFIPLVGQPLANFLQPVFFASFAMAAMKQERGGEPVMGDLLVGFQRNLRALVSLGALFVIATVAIIALMVLLGLPTGGEAETVTMVEYVKMLQGKEWILAVGFLLMILVKGALWFAPQLIAFHDMSMSHAVRWSVYAALANIGAMMAYGTLLLAIFLAGMMPWGLGLIVVIPVMAISTYVGYREVFETAAAPAPTPP